MANPSIASKTITYLYNHVFLPRKLPGKPESLDRGVAQRALASNLLSACRAVHQVSLLGDSEALQSCCRMIHLAGQLNSEQHLDEVKLRDGLKEIDEGVCVVLHVSAQNAGIIMYRSAGSSNVTFESFEASAQSASVLEAIQPLQWDFPDCAVSVPASMIRDTYFQKHFTQFIDKSSREVIKRLAATAGKATSSVFESRDTVSPTLITTMLMAQLEAGGHRVHVPRLRKHIRDDVCWAEGSELPWRRSPYYLILRIAIGRLLCRLLGGDKGRIYAKFIQCQLLSQLCLELTTKNVLEPEALSMTRAKLGRRLFKLNSERQGASRDLCIVYDHLFARLGSNFEHAMDNVKQHITNVWNNHKRHLIRPIRSLPYAADPESLILSLPLSGPRLGRILAAWRQDVTHPPGQIRPSQAATHFSGSEAAAHQSSQKLHTYAKLARFELSVEQGFYAEHDVDGLADAIHWYMSKALTEYDGDVEQKSVMLLTIMELWVLMDRQALALYPQLIDYDPGFPRNIMYDLHVLRLSDMERLSHVEKHLATRVECAKSHRPSIFGDPARGGFAECYFEMTPAMQDLHNKIWKASHEARTRKEEEWRMKSARYETLIRQVSAATCLYKIDDTGPVPVRSHDDKHCQKCYLQREASRVRITIHEEPLPQQQTAARTVIFELQIPSQYATYRNTTWVILRDLGRTVRSSGHAPKMILCDYPPLKSYSIGHSGGLCLASKTKPFANTHYATKGFPIDLDNVCLANGLKFGLFDNEKAIWTQSVEQKPTFAIQCLTTFMPRSPYFALREAVNGGRTTPNEIIASQTNVPTGLNALEHTALQDICCGGNLQWVRILREFESTNLNFSNEETAKIICRMALRAGSPHSDDILRSGHWVFRDSEFCTQLLASLDRRLETIANNWREAQCMEMLITVTLRFCHLAPPSHRQRAKSILETMRARTLDWVRALRAEIHTATNTATSEKRSTDAWWAAMLCRRTFVLQAEGDDEANLSQDQIQHFVESSITLHDNSPESLHALSISQKRVHLRDWKVAYRIKAGFLRAVLSAADGLEQALNNVWPVPGSTSTRRYSDWSLVEDAQAGVWLTSSTVATGSCAAQTVHYEILSGRLLIDERPLGRLPEQYRAQESLKELFGDRALLTFPSPLRGMSYALVGLVDGCSVHFGFDGDGIVVRQVDQYRKVLQHVPRNTFSRVGQGNDLPRPLIDGHVHWLDFSTNTLAIRPVNAMWRVKQSNWIMDLTTFRVTRRGTSHLVDPHSRLLQLVIPMFKYFESVDNLLVYQPLNSGLTIDLGRFELSFKVNRGGTIHCRELDADIDPNQDIGTLYGLESKLVLKNSKNPRERTVIIPVPGESPFDIARDGMHVKVSVKFNQGPQAYCTFAVNDILGRLDCPAEPLLMYTKAALHASTSGIQCDPLTGRTGMEEALDLLTSANAQPWRPLSTGPLSILYFLADLSPKIEYYPIDMKVMQHVSWSDNLTTTIQHDHLRPIVEKIVSQSNELLPFYKIPQTLARLTTGGDAHLAARGRHALELVQPNLRDLAGSDTEADQCLIYTTRAVKDLQVSKKYANVYELASFICRGEQRVPVTQDIAASMQQWSNISGYLEDFEKSLLSDLIDLDLSQSWGALHKTFIDASDAVDRYEILFLLSLLTFGHSYDLDLMRILAASASVKELQELQIPHCPSFMDFRMNECPSHERLKEVIAVTTPMYEDDRAIPGYRMAHKEEKKLAAAQRAHQKRCAIDCDILTWHLLRQWPCVRPETGSLPADDLLVNVDEAMQLVLPEWQRLYENHELSSFISHFNAILSRANTTSFGLPASPQNVGTDLYLQDRPHATLPILPELMLNEISHSNIGAFDDMTRVLKIEETPRPRYAMNSGLGESTGARKDEIEIRRLDSLIREFGSANDPIRRQYAADLERSLKALFDTREGQTADKKVDSVKLSKAIAQARSDAKSQLEHIKTCLAVDERAKWLIAGGFWPSMGATSLLRLLRSSADMNSWSASTKDAIIRYGRLLAWLQRLYRIERSFLRIDMNRLSDELSNDGHNWWEPHEYPDWLLLELDSNVQIRRDQVEVALQTIKPSSNANSVVQMNMGQGKTSIIIPMAAAVLANGRRLVRVIVPKPLLLQMAQLLQGRMGSLLGRPVRHLPFSRRTSTGIHSITVYQRSHSDMMNAHGMILTLPEHILSFKLSGLQRLSDGKLSEASHMINTQAWLTRCSRDILDESDHTLAVRTQLVYPSGSQTALDGAPYRWVTIQSVLQLCDGLLWNLCKDFRHSVHVYRRPGKGYPDIYFLRRDAEEALIMRLIDSICQGHGAVLPVTDCTADEMIMIRRFISEPKTSKHDMSKIARILPERAWVKQNVYLLRGLFVHRIFSMALSRRWNVQYGVSPSRDPVAVPFYAKGVASDQAEWGHPDVAILFTCLSFYYQGLSAQQLVENLTHVLKSDDPSAEYDRWTQHCSDLPGSLRDWNSLSVDDEVQMQSLLHHLGGTMVVIDHFLNNFVFPKHAKQFKTKIQASGWDIPLFDPSVSMFQKSVGDENVAMADSIPRVVKRGLPKAPASMTTGFSGTNDNRNMLPLSIKQQDLPKQSHTNATTLTYLLQDRNMEYAIAADPFGSRLSERQFLVKLEKMRIRVLIDAGAQILEMDNLSLVKAWMNVDTQAPAAIYFAEDDKAMVYHRDGYKIPLLASPYAEDTGNCLVYLDQVHTRGTDLKMPSYARGALTIGPGQSKDHTVQAAMRLRQLATTQTVVFFAPPEVHHSILDLRPNTRSNQINSQDVVYWLMEQTCRGLEQLQPLYISQGTDYCRKTQSALDNANMLDDADELATFLQVLEQPESQTLQKLYGVRQKSALTGTDVTSSAIKAFTTELRTRRAAFNDTGEAVHASALQEVEQEREVAIEVETVREVQKLPHVTPLRHDLLTSVIKFAETGRLSPQSDGIEHAFTALARTATGLKYGVNASAMLDSHLYVTSDFSKTIQHTIDRPNDNYQRPVNWIMWSPLTATALIVSPFEAEKLAPSMRDAKAPASHLIVYAAPVTRKMLQFNDLTFYAIPSLPTEWQAPRWLSTELGIFAGRLYFPFCEYKLTCKYLGAGLGGHNVQISAEKTSATAGADAPETSAKPEKPTPATVPALFTAKPLTFLNQWLSIRRKGQDFAHTPIGSIVQAKKLTRKHPFFRKNDGSPPDDDYLSDQEDDGYSDSENDVVNDEAAADDGDALEDGVSPITDSEDAVHSSSTLPTNAQAELQHGSDISSTSPGVLVKYGVLEDSVQADAGKTEEVKDLTDLLKDTHM